MQVKQRLKINTVVSIAAALVILLVFFMVLNRVNNAMETSDIADELLERAFKRSTFRSDYLLTGSERARIQWFAEHGQISRLLKAASEKFPDAEDRKIVDELINDHQTTGKIFSTIVENRGKSGLDADFAALAQEIEKRLSTQLHVRLYDKLLNIRKLHESARGRLFSALMFAGLCIFAAFVIIIAVVLINSWTVSRTITDRVLRLRDGASVIGGGNLDYRIDIKGDDEFAGLSDSFNAMTAKLDSSYNDLKNEITERKRAQEEIKRRNAVLGGINRIFKEALTCDTEEQLGRTCLSIAEEITQSKFGFIGEIGTDGLLHDIAISDPGWELCTMYDKSGHRRPPGDFKLHGIYGRVLLDGKSFFTNDPPAHPDSIGTPEGHPSLTAFLGAPLILAGRTIGMIAVGNREGGYRQEELEALEPLVPAIIEALLRVRAEEALRTAYNDLEMRVRERTKEIRELNEILEQRVAERTVELQTANASLLDSRRAALNMMEDAIAARRQIEATSEKLRQSEERYKSLAENLPSVLMRYDKNLRIVYLSPRSEEITGIPADEFEGKTNREMGMPEHLCVLWESAISEVFQTGQNKSVEFDFQSEKGTLTFYLKLSPEFGADGTVAHVLGISTDITERKRAEEALRRVKEEWELTFDSVPDMIAILDKEHRIVRANRAMAERLGLKPEECVGLPCYKYVHGTSEPPEFCPHSHTMGDGCQHFFELYEERLGGEMLVSTTPILNERGETTGSVHVARNISELKQTENSLRESEQRLKRSQEIAHLGSWELDLVNNRLYWSDEVYRIFGLQPQEFAATYEAFLEAVHPDDRAAVNDAYSGSLREGKDTYEIEHRVVRKAAGEIRYVHEKCEHFRDETGRIIRSVGMVHDITERKKYEEEIKSLNEGLRRSLRDIESANRELEAFSYSVSHDLRGPLRSVAGFSQALLEDYSKKLDPEGKDHLDRILAATQRMGQLIDDLLILSRISRAEMVRKEVNLSAVVGTIAGMLKKAHPDRDIEFIIAGGISVQGDEHLLTVALENLIRNAWKFTGNCAHAVVEFGTEISHIGHIGPIYFLRDNGAGFDMSYAEKLFKPFQRLHSEKEFPGTGIGLATVKRIIERHGGRIWIEGEVGKGTTVYFTL